MKRTLTALCLATALFGCNKETRPPTPATAPAAAAAPAAASDLPADMVVAVVDGKNVILSELDGLLAGEFAQMEKQLKDQKFKMRTDALDQLVVKRLVLAEAQKLGQSEEDWIRAQVEATTPPAGEAEAKAFFEQNKAQMPPGATWEQMSEKIVGFMTNQKRQQKANEVFAALRAKAKVDIKLEEPPIPVEAKGPAMGPEGAPITIVAFSDYQCPYCSRVEPTVKRLMADYAGKIRYVFRDFPLEFHDKAQKAAEASQCALEQSQEKYWAMHDAMFAHQDKLDIAALKEAAKTAGLDAAAFNTCLDSGKTAGAVQAHMAAGKAVGVQGTPHFFINGHALSGAQPYEEFKKQIDRELGKVAAK